VQEFRYAPQRAGWGSSSSALCRCRCQLGLGTTPRRAQRWNWFENLLLIARDSPARSETLSGRRRSSAFDLLTAVAAIAAGAGASAANSDEEPSGP